MIEKIIVKDTSTCFDSKGIELKDLGKANYIYGSNGTGKTTFSRVIKDCESYRDCKIIWKGDTKLEALVYNRDFINENFYQTKEIKGIFTLGKDSYEIQKEIRNKDKYIDEIEKSLMEFERKLEDIKKEKTRIDRLYKEKCWKLKLKYDGDFKESFIGFRVSKEKFMEKCIKEANNDSILKSYDELLELHRLLFNKEISRVDLVEKIEFSDLYEIMSFDLLENNIIGSKDVDISALIERLNNADWVREGYEYYKKTKRLCPFCQRSSHEDLETQLQNYFNEEYTLKINKLMDIEKKYIEVVDCSLKCIENVINSENQYLNKDLIKYYKNIIELKHASNKRKILKKIKEPSIAVGLERLTEELEKINGLIEKARRKTLEFNQRLYNIKTERIKLTKEVWKYIKNENEIDYLDYKKRSININNSIYKLEEIIKLGKNNKELVGNEKKRLESKITSVTRTVNEINKILSDFDFTSFKLAEVKDRGNYKVVRDNGEDAIDSLSEGEKSFISFLYFYYLLKGSHSKESISKEKIVVIDDPVVSLDNNSLFIVSNLIRDIIKKLRNEDTNIKQLFILTHNINFYRQVSFNNKLAYKHPEKLFSFFILRKENKSTKVQAYRDNPIKSPYELLWKELKNPSGLSIINMENIMKRIIKDYFKILGGFSYDDLIQGFKREEQVICKKLLSWIDSEIGLENSSLYIDSETKTMESYISVFKDIFVLSGNELHYNMMME